jgi:hypothetical protein
LYVPLSKQFRFDALLLPSAESEDPILVIDPSVQDPYSTDRVNKYKSWNKIIIPMLREKFPKHDVVCIAVWPKGYTQAEAKERMTSGRFKVDNKEILSKTYLLEKTGMEALGVQVQYLD